MRILALFTFAPECENIAHGWRVKTGGTSRLLNKVQVQVARRGRWAFFSGLLGGESVRPQVLEVRTRQRTEVVEITEAVREAVREASIDHGLVHCFVPHTTAAITLNERNDPQVVADLVNHLERLVPWAASWTHQGNAAAHIKASLLGHSIVLAVAADELVLGSWQGLFLCEFHGPRARTIQLTFQPG